MMLPLLIWTIDKYGRYVVNFGEKCELHVAYGTPRNESTLIELEGPGIYYATKAHPKTLDEAKDTAFEFALSQINEKIQALSSLHAMLVEIKEDFEEEKESKAA